MSSEGSTEKLGIRLYPFVEVINVDDIQFTRNPNSVFVDTVCEYYFDHRTVAGSCGLETKLGEVRG
jgi:hypothetical protein